MIFSSNEAYRVLIKKEQERVDFKEKIFQKSLPACWTVV